jgi:LysR family transcriptional regulator, regulator for metE and metH
MSLEEGSTLLKSLSHGAESALRALMSHHHPLTQKQFIQPEDFEHETLLSITPLSENALYRDLLRPLGIRQEKVVQVPMAEALIAVVVSNFGIAVLEYPSIKPYLHQRDFASSRITKKGLFRTWYAVHRKHNAEIIRQFMSDLSF